MLSVHTNPFDHFKPSQPDFGQYKSSPKFSNHDDHLGDSIRSSDSMTKVQQVFDRKLSEELGFSARRVPLEKINNGFDANAVANNVLGFVNNRLQQAAAEGADQEQLLSLLEQARSGVEQGIREATETLQEMGLLSDSVMEEITQMQEKIIQGLEVESGASLEQPEALRIEADHRFKQLQSSSFELQVKTQDGDLVTIKFRQQEREQGGFSLLQTDGVSQINAMHLKSSHTQMVHTVEGELDEDELTALNGLVEDLQQISESFFDGNVQAAFEQGLNVDYNPEEVAGFSLELRHSVTTLATTRYREISELDSIVAPKLPGLEQVRDLLEQMSNVLRQANQMFEDGRQVASGIVQGFVSQHPKAEDFSQRLAQTGEHDLQDLVTSLLDQAGEIGED